MYIIIDVSDSLHVTFFLQKLWDSQENSKNEDIFTPWPAANAWVGGGTGIAGSSKYLY